MSSRAMVGTGTTFMVSQDGTPLWDEDAVYILSVKPPPFSRAKIETTHLGTRTSAEITAGIPGQGTNLPSGFADYGEAEVEIAFYPGLQIPISILVDCTITFPDSSTWTFEGFIMRYTPKSPLEDRMTATISVMTSGDITYTAGS